MAKWAEDLPRFMVICFAVCPLVFRDAISRPQFISDFQKQSAGPATLARVATRTPAHSAPIHVLFISRQVPAGAAASWC